MARLLLAQVETVTRLIAALHGIVPASRHMEMEAHHFQS